MRKIYKCFIFFISIILALFLFSNLKIKADTGPKPYVSIKIIGNTNGYYMTLLSKAEHYGPYSAHVDEEYKNVDNIDLKFASYNDSDGYYYLYEYSDIKNNVYKWGYYPPLEFKILIYDSINDVFITNNIKYERKSFETAFTIELVDNSGSISFNVKEDHYHLFKVIMGLILRLVICLAIEIGIALSFKFKKLQLILVLLMNVFTQFILNLFLAIFINKYGLNMMGLVPIYAITEILIFISELMVYCFFINKVNIENHIEKAKIIEYTIIANLASLFLGFLLLTILGF